MVLATVYETVAFLIPDWLFYTYGLFGYGNPGDLYTGFFAALPDLGTMVDLAFIPDVAAMYRRLAPVSLWLEEQGVEHRTQLRIMLQRLAGTKD